MAEEKYKVGDRFNSWVILEKRQTKNRNTRWFCKCDCGKRKELDAGNIQSGKSKSCGSCAAKKRWAEGRGPK